MWKAVESDGDPEVGDNNNFRPGIPAIVLEWDANVVIGNMKELILGDRKGLGDQLALVSIHLSATTSPISKFQSYFQYGAPKAVLL